MPRYVVVMFGVMVMEDATRELSRLAALNYRIISVNACDAVVVWTLELQDND